MLLTQRPPAFHWKTLRELGGEEAEGVEGQPGARDGGERQKEKIQNGPTGEKRLEDEGGAGVQHLQTKGYIVQLRYTCRRSLRRESQCYEWGHSRGAAPRVRAVKSSELEEGKL